MTSADAANAHDLAARHRPTTERDFCQKSAAIREIGVVEIVGIARNIARGQIGAQAFKRDDFASADPKGSTRLECFAPRLRSAMRSVMMPL